MGDAMLRSPALGWILSLVIIATSAASATAQDKLWHIGWLSPSVPPTAAAPSEDLRVFREALDKLGYIEGRTYTIDALFADTDQSRLPALVRELVDRGVDVIVTIGTPPVRAAKAATSTIPIVMAGSNNPVENRLIATLAHPGGNVTGVTHNPGPPFATKALQLLKEAAPTVSRVAVLVDSGGAATGERWLGALRAAAGELGLTMLPHDVYGVKSGAQFDSILSKIIDEHAEGLFVFAEFVNVKYQQAILNFASANRLPSICQVKAFVEKGLLLYYYTDVPELRRRAAVYVDKIFKGAKPADLPVEDPSKFEFIVNMKTADALGLIIPQSVIAFADRLIE
jgi:putative tryptophan/tyrosine transport system substrate-binding protein